MAQISWFYTLPYGKKYEVNLFHGDTEHNVLIHCNGEILIIDFLVHDTNTYSFCIENHLLQMSIKLLEDGTFEYQLEGESVPVFIEPVQKSNDYWQYVLSFFIIFSFVILLIWIFSFYRP